MPQHTTPGAVAVACWYRLQRHTLGHTLGCLDIKRYTMPYTMRCLLKLSAGHRPGDIFIHIHTERIEWLTVAPLALITAAWVQSLSLHRQVAHLLVYRIWRPLPGKVQHCFQWWRQRLGSVLVGCIDSHWRVATKERFTSNRAVVQIIGHQSHS